MVFSALCSSIILKLSVLFSPTSFSEIFFYRCLQDCVIKRIRNFFLQENDADITFHISQYFIHELPRDVHQVSVVGDSLNFFLYKTYAVPDL